MKHIILLLRKELFEDRKGLLIYSIVAFSAILVSGLVRSFTQSAVSVNMETYYLEWFNNLLFFGGLIMTSITFSESMHGRRYQHDWMMLPVHAHEKLLSKFIYLGILYPLTLLVYMTAASLVTEGSAALLFGRTVTIFQPYNSEVWTFIGNYIIAHSIFLLGAAYFTSVHFLKTLLALIGTGLLLGLISILLLRIVYAPYFSAAMSDPFFFDQLMLRVDADAVPGLITTSRIIRMAFWILTAPFCLLVAYFRIREKEAVNAV